MLMFSPSTVSSSNPPPCLIAHEAIDHRAAVD